jgi:ankyrin repeat protein
MASGDPAAVQAACWAGADVNARPKEVEPAVHLAIAFRSVACLRALLQLAPHLDLQILDSLGRTPLHSAAAFAQGFADDPACAQILSDLQGAVHSTQRPL